MNLYINIEQYAEPVFKNPVKFTMPSWLKWPFLSREKLLKDWCADLSSFILKLEGIAVLIDKLSVIESQELLEQTSKTIFKIDKLSENLEKSDYLNSEELKEKYTYMLKGLYKLESKLHRKVFRVKNITTTPTELKEGISKLNAIYSE